MPCRALSACDVWHACAHGRPTAAPLAHLPTLHAAVASRATSTPLSGLLGPAPSAATTPLLGPSPSAANSAAQGMPGPLPLQTEASAAAISAASCRLPGHSEAGGGVGSTGAGRPPLLLEGRVAGGAPDSGATTKTRKVRCVVAHQLRSQLRAGVEAMLLQQ